MRDGPLVAVRFPAAPAAWLGLRLALVGCDGFGGIPKQPFDRAGYRPVLAAPRRVPDGEGVIGLDRNRLDRAPDRGRRVA
jgi:hypothetical protein